MTDDFGIPSRTRNTRTPMQQQELQRADAMRLKQTKGVAAKSPAAPPDFKAPVPAPKAEVAVPDTRPYIERYLDSVSPSPIAGRLIRFNGQTAQVTTVDDGEPVPETAEFIAVCDATLIGWIRFGTDGAPPDRIMGLLYNGFEMPERETLGDTDETQWEAGFDDGRPSDPWVHQMCVVLLAVDTQELFTFSAMNPTGRRAVANLLAHYNRMVRSGSSDYPVVRLRPGKYRSRRERVGWVHVPVFVVVGKAPRDSAARPDTSLSADLNDEIPDWGDKS
jgi:hypothetical protein